MKNQTRGESALSETPCSRLKNPWAWKFQTFQIACWSFIVGAGAQDAINSTLSLVTAIMGIGIAAMSVWSLVKAIAWEKENSSENVHVDTSPPLTPQDDAQR